MVEVYRVHARHAAARGHAVRGRRRAGHAAGLHARRGRSHGRARGIGPRRTADSRAVADGGRADSRGSRRAPRRFAGARRGRGCQRFPDRRARVASAAHPGRVRGLHASFGCLRRPLAGVYLSFFLMMTLMILVGATWMGLYLAKRITEPVQRLATAAREIEAGHLDYRVDRETVSDDEFGSLVEAFNSMASEVGKSRRRLERSTVDLERKHLEVEGRRRYIETILERIATGVVSIDASGRISTLNSAAMRLLGLGPAAVGQPASEVFGARGSAAVRRAAPRRGHREGRAVGAGDSADARRSGAAAGGRRHRAPRHRGLRRHGAGRRRRVAADSRAEGGGVARSGAASRARNQEPAHPDSTVRGADSTAFQQQLRTDAGARR